MRARPLLPLLASAPARRGPTRYAHEPSKPLRGCSRDAPAATEPLYVPPGTTSGGTGMGGMDPPVAPQGLYGTQPISLGTTVDPSAGTAPQGNAAPTGTPTVRFGTGSPGGPGTVNGNYGPLPAGAESGTVRVDSTSTPPPTTVGGAITH